MKIKYHKVQTTPAIVEHIIKNLTFRTNKLILLNT
jgi:hypothetical protein